MTNTSGRGKVGFWVLIGVLAATGISMAFIVMFGLFDSTVYSLVWRVFVADLYLIASLAAQHTWLRRTAWIGTGITFLLGIVNVFWQYTPYYKWANGRTSHRVGDYSSGWSPWFGFEKDLEYAAHVLLIGIIVLGFISLAYRWVASERVLRLVYVFTFVAGLTSLLLGAMLILDSPHRWNFGDALGKVDAGFVILALTAAAIVIIGAFVQRKAALTRTRAERGTQVLAGAVAERLVPPDTAPAGAMSPAQTSPLVPAAGITDEELRVLVRKYVDEYLMMRGL